MARNRALADATLDWLRWLSYHVEGGRRVVFEFKHRDVASVVPRGAGDSGLGGWDVGGPSDSGGEALQQLLEDLGRMSGVLLEDVEHLFGRHGPTEENG